jgi:putative transposase
MPDSTGIQPHKTIRLQSAEYTEPRLYFLTLGADWRRPLFGEIISGQISLSEIGHVVEQELRRSTEIRSELALDTYIIMPDHLHALVGIIGSEETDKRAHCRAALQAEREANDPLHPLRSSRERAPRSISSFIAQFKAYSTKRINELRGTPGQRVWQPRFHDHIVRITENAGDIRSYILANPERWQQKHP